VVIAADHRAVRNAVIGRWCQLRSQHGRHGKRTYGAEQVTDLSSLLLFWRQPRRTVKPSTSLMTCGDAQIFNLALIVQRIHPPVQPQAGPHNTESAIRQYDLRGKTISLGWAADQIAVIDIDQGQSGASAADREGFQHLVAEVSLGRAGIVLGLECSRLARNSADWHQLLELCGMTGTLICDEDGLYDPRNFNDRLLLGLSAPA
jgi:hypothetical protein